MNNNALIATVAIVIVLLVGVFLVMRRDTAVAPVTAPIEIEDEFDLDMTPGLNTPVATAVPTISGSPAVGSPTPTGTSVAPVAGKTVDVTVTGQNFSFNPATIRVKQGDTVRVTFKNASGTHDWRLDGYNVGTAVIQGGQQATVEFVADKAGQFEYYCSVGQHRQMGMKGTLTVE